MGLNFSDENEADKFGEAIELKIKDRHIRRQQSKVYLINYGVG